MAEPTFGEVVTIIKGLNNNKAWGANKITVELLKFRKETGLMFVHECILRTWCLGKALEDWKQTQIVILHKNDNQAKLDHYRGISLLDIIDKVYTWVLLGWLLMVMETCMNEVQMGFCPSWSYFDAFFTIN